MGNSFPVLETERLLLREIFPADINTVFKGLSDPGIIRHLGASYYSLEAANTQMTWCVNIIEYDTGRCWAICSADNVILDGICTLNF